MAAWLSHVPHPKLQWSLPSSRAQTLPNGHSIRVHPRVLRIASCKALIRLNVQRLVFVRPSVRARAASEEKFHQNVRSVRSRYSGRVRGRSQIFLVRSEYLLFSRVECSLYSYKIVLSTVLWRVSDLRKSARYSAPVARLLGRSVVVPSRPGGRKRRKLLVARRSRRPLSYGCGQ